MVPQQLHHLNPIQIVMTETRNQHRQYQKVCTVVMILEVGVMTRAMTMTYKVLLFRTFLYTKFPADKEHMESYYYELFF